MQAYFADPTLLHSFVLHLWQERLSLHLERKSFGISREQPLNKTLAEIYKKSVVFYLIQENISSL